MDKDKTSVYSLCINSVHCTRETESINDGEKYHFSCIKVADLYLTLSVGQSVCENEFQKRFKKSRNMMYKV